MGIARRQFMFLALGALLRADDRPKRDLLTLSAKPEDLEMPLSGFADYTTPIDRFFVRTHVAVPTVNLDSWRLTVEGEVTAPLTLTMQDIKGLPSVELMSVVECAGHGRRFYDPPVPGVQWGNGAVGNGRWRGVRLRDVLRRAGIKGPALEVLFNGADVPVGTMPDFARSIPIKKALDANTLLAYEMNGEPLPVKHGFPLRAVVPGWAGDSWTSGQSGSRRFACSIGEHDGFWMTRAY
jgi:DMSO/TMAO reductase YedYZ molybdopterin-dependent catalytic subunit